MGTATLEVGARIFRLDAVRGSNAYLVLSGDRPFLVDAGFPGEEETVRAALATHRLAVADLACVFLTHYHKDHAGAVSALVSGTDVPIVISEIDGRVFRGEAPYLSRPEKISDGMLGFLRRAGRIQEFAKIGTEWYPNRFRTVTEGARIEGFRAILAPGHTDGSLVLLDEREGVLVSADYFQYAETPLPSFLRKYLDGTDVDHEQAVRTMEALHALPFETLLPGHGPALTGSARSRLVASQRYGSFLAAAAAPASKAAAAVPATAARG